MVSLNEKFVCECDEWHRSACKNENFFGKHSGKNYCVLHYPEANKVAPFNLAIRRKRTDRDYDFKGVWFPEEFSIDSRTVQANMDFSCAHFSKSVNFSNTKFESKISFLQTCFEEIVYFNSAKFSFEAEFFQAHFKKQVWFYETEFQKKVDFRQAIFEVRSFFHETTFLEEVDFRSSKIFDNISFNSATFHDYLSYDGHRSHEQYTKNTFFEFKDTRFRKPELISFHSMNLSPHWFVDVDSRKLVFTNITWNFDIKEEIKNLGLRGIYYPEELLRIACQQLATNMEENNLYDKASKFRQIASEMEKAEKSESLRQSFKAFSKKESYKIESKNVISIFIILAKNFFVKLLNYLLHYFYKVTSLYGESWILASFILAFIFVVSTIVYTLPICSFDLNQSETDSFEKLITTNSPNPSRPTDEIEDRIFEIAQTSEKYRSLKVNESVVYSFQIGTFQSPETKPGNVFAKIFVAMETILIPLQFALLALAVRRKFMR